VTKPRVVKLHKRPVCSFCSDPAIVDGKVKDGKWGYMCLSHYLDKGTGLGMGKGSLILVGEGTVEEAQACIKYFLEVVEICRTTRQRGDTLSSILGE